MNKKISIIIPVYNTEKYIGQCLYSLIQQTYKNFEIVVIDDGSTDHSYNICQDIAKEDARINLYRQKNFGVSAARNMGISKCTGDYILFVDSDDYLVTNALEIIANKIDGKSLITFGFYKKFKDRELVFTNETRTYTNYNEIIECIFLEYSINGFLWNKLFSSKIIRNNNLKFDVNIHYSEDLLFTLNYFEHCSKLINIDSPLYYYRMRKSGVSYKFINKKNSTILDLYKMLLNKYTDNINIKNKIELLYLYDYWKFKNIYTDKFAIDNIINREKEIISNNKLSFFAKAKYHVIYRNKSIYLLCKFIKNIVENTYD